MTASAPLGQGGTLFWDDFGIRTTQMRVDLPTNTYQRIRVFTAPVQAGDTLVITGEVNLTTNVGRNAAGDITGVEYAVGAAASLWVYNASGPPELRPATYRRLGTNGENIIPDVHHIQQGLTRPWVVPADWDPAHQVGVLLRVDVHSSGHNYNAPNIDYVHVEEHGVLMAARYRETGLEARVASLESSLAALTASPTEVGEQVTKALRGYLSQGGS